MSRRSRPPRPTAISSSSRAASSTSATSAPARATGSTRSGSADRSRSSSASSRARSRASRRSTCRPASAGSPASTAASSSSPGATGSGQVDDARGDDRPHQPDAEAAHHHDRGPDRDAASRPRQHRQPARGRDRHGLVLAGAAPGAPPGPRRDPDRRAPRLRDGGDRAPGGRVGPPRLLDDAHGRCRRDDRPHDRVLPRREAADDPLDPRRRAARRRQPAAAADAGRRAGSPRSR